MKKVIFTLLFALSLSACGGQEEENDLSPHFNLVYQCVSGCDCYDNIPRVLPIPYFSWPAQDNIPAFTGVQILRKGSNLMTSTNRTLYGEATHNLKNMLLQDYAYNDESETVECTISIDGDDKETLTTDCVVKTECADGDLDCEGKTESCTPSLFHKYPSDTCGQEKFYKTETICPTAIFEKKVDVEEYIDSHSN